MRCKEFEMIIPNFIKNDLQVEQYDEFMTHFKNCVTCREELEIHYMINVGLDRIESDSQKSFDLTKELHDRLAMLSDKADRLFKYNVYKRMILYAAQTCTIICLLMQIVVFISKYM